MTATVMTATRAAEACIHLQRVCEVIVHTAKHDRVTASLRQSRVYLCATNHRDIGIAISYFSKVREFPRVHFCRVKQYRAAHSRDRFASYLAVSGADVRDSLASLPMENLGQPIQLVPSGAPETGER